jgi:hypothetical protein
MSDTRIAAKLRMLCWLRAALGALMLLLAGEGAARAMDFSTVRVENGDPLSVAIVMAGAIGPGDADRFTNYVAAARASQHVVIFVLHSPGGSVFEAERMASALRALGATVIVGPRSPCVSACFLLFAAGVKRYAEATAVIGVHSASSAGVETTASLATTALMARTAATFGVPASIVAAMLTTGPKQLVTLDRTDLLAMDVHVFTLPAPAVVVQPGAQGIEAGKPQASGGGGQSSVSR